MNEMLEVRLIDNGVSVTGEAQILASNLCDELAAVVSVNSPAAQFAAVAVAQQAQRFLKDVEYGRKAVKAPVLEISRKIDALADELSATVAAEMKRVGTLVANFQRAEQVRVAEEKRVKDAADRAAIEAKFAADEAARKAAASMTTEADLTAAIAAEAAAEAAKKAMYDELTKAAPAPVKASGSINRTVLRYEVLDQAAALAAAPHLFKIEISPSAVKATCNADSKIAGMKFWTENATSFKSGY